MNHHTRPRILVVDDDTPFVAQHLKLLLEEDGYEVETLARSGQALDRLRTRQFQLLITDYRMPELSGMELLSAVRAEGLPCGRHPAHGVRRYRAGPHGHEGRRR